MTAEKTYEVGMPEEASIHVHGNTTKIFLSGSDNHLTIRADEGTLQQLRVDVSGASLRIDNDINRNMLGPVEIDVGMTTLRKLAVGCAAECIEQGEFSGDRLEIHFSGASSLRISARYDGMELLLSGASSAEIEGACDGLRYALSGASHLKAKALPRGRLPSPPAARAVRCSASAKSWRRQLQGQAI